MWDREEPAVVHGDGVTGDALKESDADGLGRLTREERLVSVS
uniref:Uncharacterized protein n=1 Tax=Peronospora matthiolae TaxID=2874970 RepID=A0AAV1TU02_9STRA